MKLYFLYLLFFAFYFSSCDETDFNHVLNHELKEITLDENSNTMISFKDLVSDLESVVLEGADEIYLAEVSKVIEKENDLYILDRRSSKLLRFNDKGEFKNGIGKRGTLLGEFKGITDFAYSPNDNYLHLLSNYDFAVFVYDLEGFFVERIRLDFAPMLMAIHNNGNYSFYNAYAKNIDANLLETNNKGKIVNKSFKFPSSTPEMHFDYSGFLTNSHNEVLYGDAASTRIYTIASNGVNKLKYQMSFGKSTYPEKEKYNFDKFLAESRDFDNPIAYLNPYIHSSENTMVFKYTKNNKIRNGFYIQNYNGNIALCQDNFVNDFFFELFKYTNVVGVDTDGKYIFAIGYEKISQLKSKYPNWSVSLTKDFPKLAKDIRSATEYTNHLILRVKLDYQN